MCGKLALQSFPDVVANTFNPVAKRKSNMQSSLPPRTRILLLSLVVVWCGITILPAQFSPAPSAGLANDWLRSQSDAFKPWDFGGEVRARYEYREHFGISGVPGSVDFRDDSVDTRNDFLLLRAKVHLGYNSPDGWFGVFAEGRDSSTHSDDRKPSSEEDAFDLHQGYLALGNAKEFPLTAKVGRQELSYGDERLVGAFDWNNVGRVFDAAKLRYANHSLWVDGFVGRVVIPYDEHFNEANDYDWFYGVYASTKSVCPKQVTDFYFLGRNTGRQSPNTISSGQPAFRQGATARDIYTFGLRFKSLPDAFGGWDYAGELAGQFGDFAPTATASRLDHRAYAAHVGGGYTWREAGGTPRVGLEYNFASGDSDPNDGDHETFENLFPTNHKFYGYMDFVSWQNMHNVRLSASAKPHKQLTLTLDYHAFWLADTSDFFYQANGAPRTGSTAGTGTGYAVNSSYSSYVGSEVNLIATWAIKPFASVQAGYGHFFRGDYVKKSLATVGSTDADFVYVQALLKF